MKLLILLSATMATCLARPGFLAGGLAAVPSAISSGPAQLATVVEPLNLAAPSAVFSYAGPNAVGAPLAYSAPALVTSGPAAVAYSTQIYAAAPATALTSQYHAQDELGRYSYGYSGGPSAKAETRGLDGAVSGGYSYVDANGVLQSAQYVSDALNGFRVSATNLPVAPQPGALEPPRPVEDTPEVAEAKAAHAAAVADAAARAAAAPEEAAPVQEAAPAPEAAPAEARAAPAAPAAPVTGYANIIIGPGGVPLETPEVVAARAADALAHLQAKAALFGCNSACLQN